MSKIKKTVSYRYGQSTNWDNEKVISCTKTETKYHGYVETVIETKAHAICKVEDTFDLDFGRELAKAKVDGDSKLVKKLIDEKYPPAPKVEESLLDQFKKGILIVRVDTQEEKDEVVRLSGVRAYQILISFNHLRVGKDNDIVGYGEETFVVRNNKNVTFAEFKASIEPPQPVGLVDKMGILDLMVKDSNIIIKVESYDELRLAQIELRKKGVIVRIEKKDMTPYKNKGFCFHVSNGRDFCCGLDWFLAKKECTICKLENNEITPLRTEASYNMCSFSTALNLLKVGNKIARKGWNGKGIFIELQVPDQNSKMTSPYIFIDTTGLQTENPDAPKSRVPWVASQVDILADDWIVVK